MSTQRVANSLVRPVIETIDLPVAPTVAANTTAIFNVPIGRRFHAIDLKYGGTSFTLAHMTEIRVIANNEVIHRYTGTERDMMNKFDKIPAASGILRIPFERYGMVDPIIGYETALGTGVASLQTPRPINELRVEVDIGGATAPTLTATAETSANNPDQSIYLERIDRYTSENVAATGVYLHQKKLLGDKLRGRLSRLFLGDSNTNITQIRLTMDQRDILNRSSTLNEFCQQAKGKRTPQSGWVVYDPTGEGGEYARSLDLLHAATLELRTTHAATNAALPVLASFLGVLSS